MKKCLLLFVLFSCTACLQSHAQFSRYVVKLKNKTGTPFSISNPSQFLTQRSINRRLRYNIPVDETDLPLTPRYIDSIRLAGNVTILGWSKWLNEVIIFTTDAAALTKINSFDFVASSSGVGVRERKNKFFEENEIENLEDLYTARTSSVQSVAGYYDYGIASTQINNHRTDFLHNYGFRGQGMQVCVTDDGFYNYLTLPTFDSVRNNNQILGTWDFLARDSSVNEDDSHGMKCFSTMSANMPGSFVGTSPQASFYLYRTEDVATEYLIEEHYWAAGAERADSLGVDVISVSLGYTGFDNSSQNHTYSDLTGNKTIIAQAANLAAKKGMLVVAAAGNDGDRPWHYIATPGDADSALTVGAVNSIRLVASFSGYGPNFDGQIKPDVAAAGNPAVVANSTSGVPVTGSGTSYACPVMAGTATCLWQAFPEINNLQLMQGLRQSADRYATPDDRSGYGIPDVKIAFVKFIQQLHTHTAGISACVASFDIGIKASAEMNVQLERKLPSDAGYTLLHTQNFSGGFINRTFSFRDTLSAYTSGVSILYRIKMNIGADTSFYVDSAVLFYSTQCNEIAERKICPNSKTYFSVNTVNGYTAQWQVDAGSGFTNISNNTIYTGTDSNILILNNVPQNYYGYQYRCVQTNGPSTIISTPITLKFTSSWTGAVSTAWEDSNNWSCGIVPNQYIDAVIKSGAPNYPVINSNASCHAVSTMPGASLIVNTGFKLDVAGQ